MTTIDQHNQKSISMTFLQSGQPFFELSIQSSKSLSIKSVIAHIVQTISIDIKENSDAFFLNQNGQTMFAFKDQSLTQRLQVNALVGQIEEKLFYNLAKQQYEMLISEDFQSKHRIEKPMKAKNLEKKMKKFNEEAMPSTFLSPQKQLTANIPQQQLNEPQKQISEYQQAQQVKNSVLTLKPKEVSEQKLEVIKSLQYLQIEKKAPNESTHTKTQSTYFEQLNLSQNKLINPIPIRSHQLQEMNLKQIQQAKQYQIVEQHQLRSQNVQQVKEDSCCQII